jgi:PAS domain S-box-containing protein
MDRLGWLFGFGPDPVPMGAHQPIYVTADAVIAVTYGLLGIAIIWFLYRRPDLFKDRRPYAWLCGIFVLAGALTHAVDAIALESAAFVLRDFAKILAAAVSVLTVAVFWPLLPEFVRVPSLAQMEDANRRLRREVDAHEATLRELETVHRDLEQRVADRTREITRVKARFETALRGGKVYAFSQDRDLRYLWAYSPTGEGVADVVGRTDNDILPATERDAVTALKRRVVETGQAEDCEVFYPLPHGSALLSLHVEPAIGTDGSIEGITCAAIDISRLRSLESEQRRLAAELRAALTRYEIALRGSHVTVFTQDRALVYTSVSGPLFGRSAEDIVGRSEDDDLSVQDQPRLTALKREILDSAQPKDSEIRVGSNGATRWYDVHLEPLPDLTGKVVGLAGAAVDVTERKQGEAHLRLLMRELTHRSKNLLAVIQAMGRQTARHTNSAEEFLDQFGARLQALATSHDLLVQESWYGASLAALTRQQLGHYINGPRTQISIDGPPVVLRPEAAQSVGLALHELAANAAKYGALSVPDGRVNIRWQRRDKDKGDGIEISWSESDGPNVRVPDHRGFGTLVVEKNLSRVLDADVRLDFDPAGVRCQIVIPPAHILSAADTRLTRP